MSEPTPSPRRRGLPLVAAVAVVLLVLLAAVLVWQAGAHPLATGPGPVTSTGTSGSPVPSGTPSPSGPTTSAPTGCPATPGTSMPAGAAVRQVVDVDGDGRPDQAWLTSGSERRFGITTASGATFSTAIASASPLPAAAVVGLVQGRLPIALVDLGREALLYSLAGCAVTAPTNASGTPYTFDRGFAGTGTGVGCADDAGVVRLAGLDATQDTGAATYSVTRTWVNLSADGRSARNGSVGVLAHAVAAGDPAVVSARQVSCGTSLAGRDGPVEPA